ncbi:DsbA family protein [Thalassotalea fonticola]|uniref:DsbA family protein n=1 Tax=Thalassotalea fonticola TaxID=3065649 RepID=A0ABZ0GTM0_9GAMM|nr:DsbA family protein [Colwelliaceae bacterium S1-1]
MIKPVLYYIYDPMCSWCWGYRPTWQALQEKLKSTIEVQYRVGGLAPDSNEAMSIEMQHFLQQTWHKIAAQLGTEFNFDFWTQCQPIRSTYPACRAVLIAREYNLEQDMYLAIQQAYYLQAKNPANIDTLVNIAAELGLDVVKFEKKILSEDIQLQLTDEVAFVRNMPIQGFPSLVLSINGELKSIAIDYQHWQVSYEAVIAYLPTEQVNLS